MDRFFGRDILSEEFSSLSSASKNEIYILKEENSALNALKEEISALKKKYKELEENLTWPALFRRIS